MKKFQIIFTALAIATFVSSPLMLGVAQAYDMHKNTYIAKNDSPHPAPHKNDAKAPTPQKDTHKNDKPAQKDNHKSQNSNHKDDHKPHNKK